MITLSEMIVITDIDGVWTNGKFFLDGKNVIKAFHTYDSAGVLLLRHLGIKLHVVTGEDDDATRQRMEKLQLTNSYHPGIKVKDEFIESTLLDGTAEWSDVVYIGDDINDVKSMNKSSKVYLPNSTTRYIQKLIPNATLLSKAGGDGAFREAIEHLVVELYDVSTLLNLYKDLSRHSLRQ